MSRTYRFRKDKFIPWWNDYSWKEWVECTEEEYNHTKYDTKMFSYRYYSPRTIYEVKLDPKSQKAKELRAKQHKDNGHYCKEPGPSWFRNLTVERPLRRKAKRQLEHLVKHCYIDDILEYFDIELIEPKPKLDYWT